jgi:hypothetical protein
MRPRSTFGVRFAPGQSGWRRSSRCRQRLHFMASINLSTSLIDAAEVDDEQLLAQNLVDFGQRRR